MLFNYIQANESGRVLYTAEIGKGLEEDIAKVLSGNFDATGFSSLCSPSSKFVQSSELIPAGRAWELVPMTDEAITVVKRKHSKDPSRWVYMRISARCYYAGSSSRQQGFIKLTVCDVDEANGTILKSAATPTGTSASQSSRLNWDYTASNHFYIGMNDSVAFICANNGANTTLVSEYWELDENAELYSYKNFPTDSPMAMNTSGDTNIGYCNFPYMDSNDVVPSRTSGDVSSANSARLLSSMNVSMGPTNYPHRFLDGQKGMIFFKALINGKLVNEPIMTMADMRLSRYYGSEMKNLLGKTLAHPTLGNLLCLTQYSSAAPNHGAVTYYIPRI